METHTFVTDGVVVTVTKACGKFWYEYTVDNQRRFAGGYDKVAVCHSQAERSVKTALAFKMGKP